MKRSPRTSPARALGFDPNAVMLREPGVLLDPAFLGALHAQLEDQLGPAEAAVSLRQIGLLHGLQEGERVLTRSLAADRPGAALPHTSLLALRCTLNPAAHPPGAIEVGGSWPDRSEAQARLSLLGPGSEPCCHVSAGFTSGWLSAFFDADILAVETDCCATGADACRFVAREVEAWALRGDARAAAILEGLPFDALRALATSQASPTPEPGPARPPSPSLEPEATVVHIWGPVMVVPFSGPDEAVRAVELIGHDPAAREVSVIVVDLAGAVVDETFDAVALEQIVESAESWGADTIFTGVSPLSEAVVAGLERPPLLIEKDLAQAVATAFRIVEAQSRPV